MINSTSSFHTAKIPRRTNRSWRLERLHHAFQNRFGSFGRQSDRKGCVGIRPHQNQHRDLSPPVGEIDINLAEVRFQPLTGFVIEWDERFALIDSMLPNESANRVVTAGIAVLIPQPFKDPHRRMPLFWRLRLVVGENLSYPLMKRSQLGSRLSLTPRRSLWLPFAP